MCRSLLPFSPLLYSPPYKSPKSSFNSFDMQARHFRQRFKKVCIYVSMYRWSERHNVCVRACMCACVPVRVVNTHTCLCLHAICIDVSLVGVS